MKSFPVFFKLEYKRAYKMLPGFLAGAIVLMILLSTIAFLAGKIIYKDTGINKISVGIILPKEDKVAQKAMDIIGSMDSVKSICEFEYIDAPSGKEQIIMLIPDDFVENVINGINTPVTIVFPKQTRLELILFREMADAGAKLLSTSQAAIYASDDFLAAYGIEERIPASEAELNKIFIRYTLSRESMLRKYTVSATGDISALIYFSIYMLILCLMLLGIPASSVLRPFSPVMEEKLKLNNISVFKIVMTRVCIITSMLMLVSAIAAAIIYILFKGSIGIRFPIKAIAEYLIICVCIASMLVCIYRTSLNNMASVMMVFLLSVGMIFISGGFIPSVFLPEYIRKASAYMPTTYMAYALKGIITGTGYLKNTTNLSIMTLIFLLLSLIRRKNI